MTKKQLIEVLTKYPDEATVCLMYSGGDTCRLEFMQDVPYRDIIALEPVNCAISNDMDMESFNVKLYSMLNNMSKK